MRIQVTRFLRFSNCIEFDRSLKTKIHQNRHGQKSNQNAALDFDRAIKWQFTKIVTVKLKTKRGARVWPSIKNRNSPKSSRSKIKSKRGARVWPCNKNDNWPKSARSKSTRNAARDFDRALKSKIHKNRHGQFQNETRRARLTVRLKRKITKIITVKLKTKTRRARLTVN